MDRLREYWKAFFGGLTQPSLPALLGMLLVACLAVLASMKLVTPHFFSGPGYGIFVEDSNDEYAFLTADILRIQENPPEIPVVLYFGTSSLREALTSRGHLEELLQERMGRKIKVFNLTAGGLTHWEISAMLDSTLNLVHGVVVLPCSPAVLTEYKDRLSEITDSPRLALRSPSLEKERSLIGLDLRGPGSGNFFRDNYQFFVARLVPMLKYSIKGRQWRDFHAGDKWRDPNEAELRRFIEVRALWVARMSECGDFNAEAYQRLLDRLEKKPNLHISLLENVANPKTNDWVRSLPGYEAAQATYEGYVDRFLAGERRSFHNYETTLDLKPEDFKDTVHFKNPHSRERFTELLADDLAAIFAANPELLEKR